MKQVVIGTAGHIDHGKTALIKALTGIDCDRLKEEKERGITIDLGFAFIELGDGIHAGIVDVPGHERFVKNMLAGAGGIDLVLLVVAADEGVMPQTREHLAICELLRVKDGLVALTKRDLVEADWLELVKEDVLSLTEGTFLSGKSLIPLSSVTGEGLAELLSALKEVAARVPPKEATGPFRLPIDRVFIKRGFGAVVTGTLLSGRVKLGEIVEVFPKGLRARVRGIQVHGKPSEEALAGLRTAINLQGLDKWQLERGDVLAHPGGLAGSYMLDVELEHLPSAPRPLKDRSRVRFHSGTSEVIGRVALIGEEELKPGGRGYAQLRLESPVALLPRDRFVIRSYSPLETVGGGEVLDALPRKHHRRRAETLQRFRRLAEASDQGRLELHLEEASFGGLDPSALALRVPLPREVLRALLREMVAEGRAVILDEASGLALSGNRFRGLRKKIAELLEAFHRKNPLRHGMLREELRSRLSAEVPERAFTHALRSLEEAGEVVSKEQRVRLSHHEVQVGEELSRLKERVEEEFLRAGAQPPDPEAAVESFGPKAQVILRLLVDEGALVRVKDCLFHKEALAEVKEKLKAALMERGELTAAEFRDILGITRKHAIPLLEYFDGERLTMRVGDKRLLREAAGRTQANNKVPSPEP